MKIESSDENDGDCDCDVCTEAKLLVEHLTSRANHGVGLDTLMLAISAIDIRPAGSDQPRSRAMH